MVYSHVSCEGWEGDISNCEKLMYEDFTCLHYTVAGVMVHSYSYLMLSIYRVKFA